MAVGIFTYNNLQVELFPKIEFPLVTVMTFYPSADPEAVVRDVTVPIENVISGVEGIDTVQSISSENLSLLLANFKFGTDMADAQRTIAGRVSGIQLPTGVEQPRVARINPDEFPVLQLSVAGDRPIPALQRLVESLVRPAILGVDGVLSADVTGDVDQQVFVTVDPDRLSEFRLSLFQVSGALSDCSGRRLYSHRAWMNRKTPLVPYIPYIPGTALNSRRKGMPLTFAHRSQIRRQRYVHSSTNETLQKSANCRTWPFGKFEAGRGDRACA